MCDGDAVAVMVNLIVDSSRGTRPTRARERQKEKRAQKSSQEVYSTAQCTGIYIYMDMLLLLTKRDEKEIFLETIVVSSSSPGVVHILSARALLCKKRRRDNLAD